MNFFLLFSMENFIIFFPFNLEIQKKNTWKYFSTIFYVNPQQMRSIKKNKIFFRSTISKSKEMPLRRNLLWKIIAIFLFGINIIIKLSQRKIEKGCMKKFWKILRADKKVLWIANSRTAFFGYHKNYLFSLFWWGLKRKSF